MSRDFRACQWQHPDGFNPTCETVGHPRQSHDVGFTGQQETARTVVFVYRLLDRQEKFRRTLNFVDNDLIQTPDETNRIGLRNTSRVVWLSSVR